MYTDEVFIKIRSKRHSLWQAVGQDGEVVDVYFQAKRNGVAAKRFVKRLLRSHGGESGKIGTDKLRSYGTGSKPNTVEILGWVRLLMGLGQLL